MQIDMHFYGVYALCRAAGINEETAAIIAHSSQYVDDALGDDTLDFKKGKKAILPTMTAHKPLDLKNGIEEDQWRVWAIFHFLPGNDPQAKTFMEKMICQMNSKIAREVLQFALSHKKENFSSYLAGIVAHVYADTFSHYGFIGLESSLNRVAADSIHAFVKSDNILKYVYKKLSQFRDRILGTAAEIIPIGHGAAATLPDRPYLRWKFRYEHKDKEEPMRENWRYFLRACELLHQFFLDFNKNNPEKGDINKAISFDASFRKKIENILKKEGTKEERIKAWRKAIQSNLLFNSTEKDRKIDYRDKMNVCNGLTWQLSEDDRKEIPESEIKKQHLYYFYEAAWKYRNYVLHELFPRHNLLA